MPAKKTSETLIVKSLISTQIPIDEVSRMVANKTREADITCGEPLKEVL